MKILCQACTPKSKKGCHRCGGFKELLVERVACEICKRKAWFKVGVFSRYEGQRYQTFDGLEMIAHLVKPDNCRKCESDKP
jgi:hypothetical protein